MLPSFPLSELNVTRGSSILLRQEKSCQFQRKVDRAVPEEAQYIATDVYRGMHWHLTRLP